MPNEKIGIFVFRRDLRLEDNTTLIYALKNNYKIIPVFIFDPIQINSKINKYFSNSAVQFMIESCISLDKNIQKYSSKLHYFMGDLTQVLELIYKEMKFSAYFTNLDYTNYAEKRAKIEKDFCKSKNIDYVSFEDYSTFPYKTTLKDDNRPYTRLSLFLGKYLDLKINKPEIFEFQRIHFVTLNNFQNSNIDNLFATSFFDPVNLSRLYIYNENIEIKGGRENALKTLENILKLKNYSLTRDNPSLLTSRSSPHLKFGTFSIREFYHKVLNVCGKESDLLREIAFREFYIRIFTTDGNRKFLENSAWNSGLDKYIKWRDPGDLSFFLDETILFDKKEMKKIKNSENKSEFWKWVFGKTGIPIIDAGMRELLYTGFQHNRVRMICGSFLAKHLLIDWRLGRLYYSRALIDCCPVSNTAGWAWVSSTGPDAPPFFRPPFNPYIQTKRFDENCIYIKKWVPELKNIDNKDILKWDNEKIRKKYKGIIGYEDPMVDIKITSKRCTEELKRAWEESKLNK